MAAPIFERHRQDHGSAGNTLPATARADYPRTPDGRYFVVRERLWRCTNPALPEDERRRKASNLMSARRAVGAALKRGDETALKATRAEVNDAKIALGERGPVWWSDGAPDFNRRLVKNTPYAEWFGSLAGAANAATRPDSPH